MLARQRDKQIFHFGPAWVIKDEGWEKFTRCYTITLKSWDEFNANFILLYFSSYRSIKIWDFYTKNVEKKKQ